ncbi:MAG: restriction endonuclease subunit S [bacterium]|nr:restriction endonuclease subunit S [bacterium]
MTEWKECTLGDILTFQRGHDLPKRKMTGCGYPVAGSNGIIGYHSEFTTESPAITIGRSGNVGNPYIYYEPIWAHNTTLYVKEYKNVIPEFAYYFLKALDLSSYAGGSAVPTLNRNHIHTLPIRIPDMQSQNQIARILKVLDDKIEINVQINRNFDVLAA